MDVGWKDSNWGDIVTSQEFKNLKIKTVLVTEEKKEKKKKKCELYLSELSIEQLQYIDKKIKHFRKLNKKKSKIILTD